MRISQRRPPRKILPCGHRDSPQRTQRAQRFSLSFPPRSLWTRRLLRFGLLRWGNCSQLPYTLPAAEERLCEPQRSGKREKGRAKIPAGLNTEVALKERDSIKMREWSLQPTISCGPGTACPLCPIRAGNRPVSGTIRIRSMYEPIVQEACDETRISGVSGRGPAALQRRPAVSGTGEGHNASYTLVLEAEPAKGSTRRPSSASPMKTGKSARSGSASGPPTSP